MSGNFVPTDIPILNLMLAYLFGLLIWGFGHSAGKDIGKQLLVSIFRMTVQLFLIASVLVEVFSVNFWGLTVAIYILMLFFATQLVVSRCGINFRGMVWVMSGSMGISVTAVLGWILFFVIRSPSFLEARHLIPLAGMIFCNSMNGAALAVERFFTGLKSGRHEFETLLSLGATANEASRKWFSQAFRASMTPMLLTMASTGLVALPGMMVGQILCGFSPLFAVKYQIVILLAMTASVTMTSLLSLKMATRFFFTSDELLREEIFLQEVSPEASLKRGKCGGGGGGSCRGGGSGFQNE